MREFYLVTQAIHSWLESTVGINTVNYGDVFSVDLQKQSIFPLANLNVTGVDFQENFLVFNINILFMDIANTEDKNLKDAKEPFLGSDNKHYVLNSLLGIANKLQLELKKGSLNEDGYNLDSEISAAVFEDRFENLLTGWSVDYAIQVPNGEIDICT
jgi:hypothetical protein